MSQKKNARVSILSVIFIKLVYHLSVGFRLKIQGLDRCGGPFLKKHGLKMYPVGSDDQNSGSPNLNPWSLHAGVAGWEERLGLHYSKVYLQGKLSCSAGT